MIEAGIRSVSRGETEGSLPPKTWRARQRSEANLAVRQGFEIYESLSRNRLMARDLLASSAFQSISSPPLRWFHQAPARRTVFHRLVATFWRQPKPVNLGLDCTSSSGLGKIAGFPTAMFNEMAEPLNGDPAI